MVKTLSVSQIQELDRWAIEELGIPSAALMENAGRAVAEFILKKFKSRSKASVTIVCGVGNNGGDGFVVARHLFNRGIKPKVFLIGDAQHLKADALTNYRVLKKMGITIRLLDKAGLPFRKTLQSSDVIVDAIFGVGLNRPVQAPYDGIMEAINKAKSHVIAVDVPSGLDATTGEIYGVCIKAKTTITFSYAKKGFFLKQGPRHTGRLVVADIGIPFKSR